MPFNDTFTFKHFIKHTTLFSLDISLLVIIPVKLKQEKLCLVSLVDQTYFFLLPTGMHFVYLLEVEIMSFWN